MGTSLRLIDANKLFQETASERTLIVNDQQLGSDEARERYKRLVFTTYEGDVLDNVPTCVCEYMSKAHNIGGGLCPKCNTPVEYQVERDLEPILWARAPNGVASLMSPHVWLMLEKLYSKGKFSIIRWIADPFYQPPNKRHMAIKNQVADEMAARGIKRGWNSFIENFFTILDILDFAGKKDNDAKKKAEDRGMLRRLIETHRDMVFPRYLPFPNRSILVLEKNNLGRFSEKTLWYAVDAAMTLYGVDRPESTKSQRSREHLTMKTVTLLADFSKIQYSDVLGKKPGLFRKHVFAFRCRFSFRAVASSITGPHHYRQIQISWGVATTVFAEHIAAKLLARGWTPREIDRLLNEYALQYNETLAQIFDELITESKYELGIPCVVQRNPSLERGSAQSVFISQVKLPGDPTVSISILIVKGMNAKYFWPIRQ